MFVCYHSRKIIDFPNECEFEIEINFVSSLIVFKVFSYEYKMMAYKSCTTTERLINAME